MVDRQLRSPPPPASQNSQHGGYGGYGGQQNPAQGQGNSYMHPAFGGLMSDPTTQMGVQLGRSAVEAGQQYMEQNVSDLVNRTKVSEI